MVRAALLPAVWAGKEAGPSLQGKFVVQIACYIMKLKDKLDASLGKR